MKNNNNKKAPTKWHFQWAIYRKANICVPSISHRFVALLYITYTDKSKYLIFAKLDTIG